MMSHTHRLLAWGFAVLAALVGIAALALYSSSWRPARNEMAAYLCPAQTPSLKPGQPLKVLTWDIQFLAGKRYVFWYDRADGSGPDERPSSADLAFDLDEVVRVLRAENPDVVLLQEVDDNAKATDYADQLTLLQERLSDLYPCHAQAFDWKADFVPDRHIFGSVGRKLVTLSRYRIEHADRVQLPTQPGNLISRQFQPKRALLISYLAIQDLPRYAGSLAVLNTQFDTARGDHGADTLAAQVEKTLHHVDTLEAAGTPWLLGGNLNLLPLGQYQRLPAPQRDQYSADSELHTLWEKYPMIPSNAEASGEQRATWLTYAPNGTHDSAADRTLDYLFHSPHLRRTDAAVRQQDTLAISPHLPVIATFTLPLFATPQ